MVSLMGSGPSKSIAKTPQGGNVLVLIGPGGRLTGIRSRFCSTSHHLSPLIVRYHTLLRNFCLVPKMPFWPSLAWDNTLALRLYGITILVLLDTISNASQLTTAAWKVLFVG